MWTRGGDPLSHDAPRRSHRAFYHPQTELQLWRPREVGLVSCPQVVLAFSPKAPPLLATRTRTRLEA